MQLLLPRAAHSFRVIFLHSVSESESGSLGSSHYDSILARDINSLAKSSTLEWGRFSNFSCYDSYRPVAHLDRPLLLHFRDAYSSGDFKIVFFQGIQIKGKVALLFESSRNRFHIHSGNILWRYHKLERVLPKSFNLEHMSGICGITQGSSGRLHLPKLPQHVSLLS